MGKDISRKSKLAFGDRQSTQELEDSSVHLVVTSPPYFNAPFDYPDLFESHGKNPAKELKRVLDEGRVAAFVVDDTLVNGVKYPIVAEDCRHGLNIASFPSFFVKSSMVGSTGANMT